MTDRRRRRGRRRPQQPDHRRLPRAAGLRGASCSTRARSRAAAPRPRSCCGPGYRDRLVLDRPHADPDQPAAARRRARAAGPTTASSTSCPTRSRTSRSRTAAQLTVWLDRRAHGRGDRALLARRRRGLPAHCSPTTTRSSTSSARRRSRRSASARRSSSASPSTRAGGIWQRAAADERVGRHPPRVRGSDTSRRSCSGRRSRRSCRSTCRARASSPTSIVFGRQRRVWTLPRGGSGALTDALVRFIEDHGGDGAVRPAGSRRLLLEGGRCAGVETEAGERFRAREAVVSTIHVKHLLEMAPADALGRGLPLRRRDVRRRRVRLRRLPGDDRGAGVRDRGRAAQRGVGRARRLAAGHDRPRARAARRPLRRRRRVAARRHADARRSLARARGPPHGQVPQRAAVARRAPVDRRARSTGRPSASSSACRAVAPGFTDDAILASLVKSPGTSRRQNPHMIRGTFHGGDRTHRRRAARCGPRRAGRQHRMPIPGLYQTGGTTHPGGSITGAPGAQRGDRAAAGPRTRPRGGGGAVPDARVQAAIDNWAPRFIARTGVDHNDFRRTTARHRALGRLARRVVRDRRRRTARCARGARAPRAASAPPARRCARRRLLTTSRSSSGCSTPSATARTTEQAIAALDAAHALLDPTAERIEAPLDGARVVGNLRRPRGRRTSRRSSLLIPGLDSTKEEFFQLGGASSSRAGWRRCRSTGPGQGETGFALDIRPDYEVAVARDPRRARRGRERRRPRARRRGGRQPRRLLRAARGRVRAAHPGGRRRSAAPYDFGANWDGAAVAHARDVRSTTRARATPEEARERAAELTSRRRRAHRRSRPLHHRPARPADPVGGHEADRRRGAAAASGCCSTTATTCATTSRTSTARSSPTGCGSELGDRRERAHAGVALIGDRRCGRADRRRRGPRRAARGDVLLRATRPPPRVRRAPRLRGGDVARGRRSSIPRSRAALLAHAQRRARGRSRSRRRARARHVFVEKPIADTVADGRAHARGVRRRRRRRSSSGTPSGGSARRAGWASSSTAGALGRGRPRRGERSRSRELLDAGSGAPSRDATPAGRSCSSASTTSTRSPRGSAARRRATGRFARVASEADIDDVGVVTLEFASGSARRR